MQMKEQKRTSAGKNILRPRNLWVTWLLCMTVTLVSRSCKGASSWQELSSSGSWQLPASKDLSRKAQWPLCVLPWQRNSTSPWLSTVVDLSRSCIMQVRLQLWTRHVAPLDPSAAESCDIRGSWGYSEAYRLLPRKFGFWLETGTPVFLWDTRVVCYTRHTETLGWKCLVIKSTVRLVCDQVWLVQFRESAKLFFPVVVLTNVGKRDSTIRTQSCVIAVAVFAFLSHMYCFSLFPGPGILLSVVMWKWLNQVNAAVYLCWAHLLFLISSLCSWTFNRKQQILWGLDAGFCEWCWRWKSISLPADFGKL